MIKILSIFGTRPEAIKMAPVIKGLEQHPENEPICEQESTIDFTLESLNSMLFFDKY